MKNKFSFKYFNYRLHQLLYFKQILKRKDFNFLIDKKLAPIYNFKNLILNYDSHESEEIYLIKKNIYPLNTLELGCSLGVVSLNIKKLIKNKNLISIDGNNQAINYCKENMKYNSKFPISFFHHIIGNQIDFKVDENNFLSSRISLKKTAKIDISKSVIYIDKLIKENDIECIVVDIEGMEKIIIDKLDLSKIKLLFIELHPLFYGNIVEKDIIENILNLGFVVIDKINSNYCFKKNAT